MQVVSVTRAVGMLWRTFVFMVARTFCSCLFPETGWGRVPVAAITLIGMPIYPHVTSDVKLRCVFTRLRRRWARFPTFAAAVLAARSLECFLSLCQREQQRDATCPFCSMRKHTG